VSTDTCSSISLSFAEPLAGTADLAQGFVLLEHADSWSTQAFESPSLPDGVGTNLQAAAAAADLKPLLGRRHGRERGTGSPWILVAVPDHGGILVHRRLASTGDAAVVDLVAVATALRSGQVPTGWERTSPVLAVCTHAKRDQCCARSGRPVAAALHALAPEMVWECSHLGGHRLAGNVLELPSGLLYGRVAPGYADVLVEGARGARVLPDLLRGRSHLPQPLQVAEVALRQLQQAAGADDVQLVGSSEHGLAAADITRSVSTWTVQLPTDTAAATWRVVVDTSPGTIPRPASCGNEPQAPPPVHTVVEITDVEGPGRGAQAWDEGHAAAGHELADPDPTVVDAVQGLSPGTVLDLACGRGRHSLWLAGQGWQVTAVDFSRAALDQLRQEAGQRGLDVDVQLGDARAWTPPATGYDLVLLSFVHLPDVLVRATRWLAPGGHLVLVGHSTRNLTEGVGGPQDPRLLHQYVDLAARATGARLRVLRAGEVERHTPEGTAIDAVLVAQKPLPQ